MHRLLKPKCLLLSINKSLQMRFFSLTKSEYASNIGFVGLGNMGQGMVNNVLTKQIGGKVVTVHAFDIDTNAVNAAKKLGANGYTNLEGVVGNSDAIITMLPNNDIVRDVIKTCLSSSNLKPNTFFLDSSTIDPSVSQEVAGLCKAKDCLFVDSPVSGGVPGADAGTLTFMIGADKESEYDRAKDILQPMGRLITHCGPVGAGQVAKICNNMLLAISMIGVSEAMNLGISLGLDKDLLTKIICSSTGKCWSAEMYNPVPNVMENVPSSKGYAGGFNTQLISKDLGLAQDAANRAKVLTPLGAMAHQIYRIMSNDERFADKDFAAVYQYLQTNKK